jgi:hypothetical protein
MRRILRTNTSVSATSDELVCKTTHAMKKGMLLSSVFAMVALTLVSCSSEPDTTTTTTRQTTVTTAAPPPVPPSQTTTTTTHMGSSGY